MNVDPTWGTGNDRGSSVTLKQSALSAIVSHFTLKQTALSYIVRQSVHQTNLIDNVL